jgi:hypothetical protein
VYFVMQMKALVVMEGTENAPPLYSATLAGPKMPKYQDAPHDMNSAFHTAAPVYTIAAGSLEAVARKKELGISPGIHTNWLACRCVNA